MLHDLVQFVDCRASVALAALSDDAEAFRDNEGILDRLTVERIAPSRFSNGKDRAKVAQVILARGRRGWDRFHELNDIGAGDLAASHLGNVIAFDRAQHLRLGAADGALVFPDIDIDSLTEWRIAISILRAIQRPRFSQLGFAASDPSAGRLLSVECLSLLMDYPALDLHSN